MPVHFLHHALSRLASLQAIASFAVPILLVRHFAAETKPAIDVKSVGDNGENKTISSIRSSSSGFILASSSSLTTRDNFEYKDSSAFGGVISRAGFVHVETASSIEPRIESRPEGFGAFAVLLSPFTAVVSSLAPHSEEATLGLSLPAFPATRPSVVLDEQPQLTVLLPRIQCSLERYVERVQTHGMRVKRPKHGKSE